MNIKKAIKMLTITATIATLLNVSITKMEAAPSPIILGYYTVDSGDSFIQFHNYMNQMSTDTFNTDDKGNLVGEVPKETVAYANAVEVLPYALVSNYGARDWDSHAAHQVLTNRTAKKKLIQNMLALAETNHYKGINIDFEAVLPEDRQALTSFVQEVAGKMKAKGFLTMVSVPAKADDDPTDDWTGAFDFEALGKAADMIQVMTYDEHGVWRNAGSVASKPWIESALQFAITYVPSEKVLMGIPTYGNDWNLSDPANKSNAQVMWKDIPNLIADTGATPIRDEWTGSMYFNYTDTDGASHVVWYEDETSILQKTQYIHKYWLAGVSIYALGMEDYKFWEAVSAGLQ
ncbi:glycosyl hydrolase family 18 protein [Paenibacillus taiwanensis]|uniref:glycosyl hydrolase family 18 protein n=1 Tax=Paenibacillus taiwanensis TaxID=401638 RepID=UPI0003FD4462|nr:glycosyl hydrolase family 18 protein [Paenibacillus taiwanensis]